MLKYDYYGWYVSLQLFYVMYDKQIKSKFKHSQSVKEPTRSSEKQLMQLWLEGDINESYQNIVLQYLDQLQTMNQWIEIQKQLKKTYERSTHYHRINNLCKERQRILEQVSLEITQLDEWSSKIETKYPQLEGICDLLNQLRKITMIICQEVTIMFQKFRYNPEQKPSLGSFYLVLFRNFNESLLFLKDSYLSNYIPFSEGYDPLFVDPLKSIQQKYNSNQLINDYYVKQLFHLNASYMYRLLRSHQKMLQYSNLSYQIEKEDPQPFYQSFGADKFNKNGLDSIGIKEQQKQKKAKNIEEIVIKDPRILPPSSIENTQPQKKSQNPPLKRYVTQTNETPKKGKVAISRLSKPIQTDHASKDRIFQIQDLSRTVDKSRYKSVPNRSKTIENQVERTSNPKRFNTGSKLSPKYENKNTNLPSISKNLKIQNFSKVSFQRQDHFREQTDSFCRKKTKQQKNYEPLAELTSEEYQEKRKSIIRTVREKYREIAKKQIQYELSKLGDRTYHLMKSRYAKKK